MRREMKRERAPERASLKKTRFFAPQTLERAEHAEALEARRHRRCDRRDARATRWRCSCRLRLRRRPPIQVRIHACADHADAEHRPANAEQNVVAVKRREIVAKNAAGLLVPRQLAACRVLARTADVLDLAVLRNGICRRVRLDLRCIIIRFRFRRGSGRREPDSTEEAEHSDARGRPSDRSMQVPVDKRHSLVCRVRTLRRWWRRRIGRPRRAPRVAHGWTKRRRVVVRRRVCPRA